LVVCKTADEALARICQIYEQNAESIARYFIDTLGGTEEQGSPAPYEKAVYPYLGLTVTTADLHLDTRLAYGLVADPGTYGTTLTRPDLFYDYYKEQIELLIKHHQVPVVVGVSDVPIPAAFVLERKGQAVTLQKLSELVGDVALPNLSQVNDDIANSTYRLKPDEPKPLAHFSALRVDYSLHRLHHYTGTTPEHFQGFILLTNYQRYIHEFKQYALAQLENGDEFSAFVEPGDAITYNKRFSEEGTSGVAMQHLPQMPAYHLKRPDNQGITFINIGVGPTNAKTITDHLAVLRPHCWVMLGHCAGFRRNQLLGDYVLVHAYVRDDHVLDADLPVNIPIPPIAEVQIALQETVANVTGQRGLELKTRMRTGTIITTDNRNWELRSHELIDGYKQSRAIALDMESATIAANGFRFRVPYGTLLCVSDKPLHGELKLRSMANAFYQERVSQHLKIGIESVRLLRERGVQTLHSRKLRGFDEPPFR
jgi:AMP nucleosidase